MDSPAPIDRRATVRWTTVATSFGFALSQLDVTIVNVALPRMAAVAMVLLVGVAAAAFARVPKRA